LEVIFYIMFCLYCQVCTFHPAASEPCRYVLFGQPE
jgi:hypothetical protein